MRMNPFQGISAAEFLQTASESDLLEIFENYGEIKRPKKAVQKIIEARSKKPITRTLELAQLIESTVPVAVRWQKPRFHPATLYFQALRIFINRELEQLQKALPLLIHQLESRGLLAVLTFHSLEDRLVKNTFKNHPLGEPLFKTVIQADELEVKKNPRSRSAKLRIFIKEKSPPKPKNKYLHLVGKE
jgi:16S rRNA (cytosine1402-N4)-methyltransferase